MENKWRIVRQSTSHSKFDKVVIVFKSVCHSCLLSILYLLPSYSLGRIPLNHCCVSATSCHKTSRVRSSRSDTVVVVVWGAGVRGVSSVDLFVTSGKLEVGHPHEALALHFLLLYVLRRGTKRRLDTSCIDTGGLSYAGPLQWALPGVGGAGFDFTWLTQGARTF